MDSRPQKPSTLPTPTALPFWDGLKQGKILLQFSPSSQKWVFYPRVLAPGTLADDLEWREVSGGGILYTFAIARYPTAPAWKASTPQLLGVVELDEGPRLTTEIVEASPEELRVGMRMRPVLGAAPDGDVTMLRFAPDWSGG